MPATVPQRRSVDGIVVEVHYQAAELRCIGRSKAILPRGPTGVLDQPARGCTSWRHVVSDDLLHWEDFSIVLPPGTGDDPDIDGIWTGSLIERDGILHIFYTGGRRSAEMPQTICHATSPDGVTFVKDPTNPIMLPPADPFEKRDWRDPFDWRPPLLPWWSYIQ